MLYKIFTLILISSIKFIFAFPLAIGYQFSFHTTILYTSVGGIFGVLFFGFLSDELIRFYNWFVLMYLHRHQKFKGLAKSIKDNYRQIFPKKQRKIFSKRSKRFVRIKQRYGLAGIALLTPLILSIPIGTFLAIRFYKRTKKTIFFLCISVLFWSLTMSSIVYYTGFRY